MNATDVFELALRFTLEAEGGYSDNPADPGGATNHGITQHTYSAWLGEHSMPDAPVKNISSQEVRDIYCALYWQRPHVEDIASAGLTKTAIALFDWYVNAPAAAAQNFQQLVGSAADGAIGPSTVHHAITVAGTLGDATLANQVVHRRSMWYLGKPDGPSKHVFINGWLRRCETLQEYLNGIP